jgi:shikimate dehydrogenase
MGAGVAFLRPAGQNMGLAALESGHPGQNRDPPSTHAQAQAVSSPAVQPILALLSDSVSGNPTQYVVEKALAHHELDWRYLTFEVAAEELQDAIRGMRAMGFRGGHLGSLHRKAVIRLLDRTTQTAQAIGAANLIFREDDDLVGDNTEGKGLLRSLGRLTDPAGKRIVLLGAGLMARAAAVELAQAAPAEILIVNRTRQHAQSLADLLAEKYRVAASAVAWEGDYEVPLETDVLIDATSIGQQDPEARVPLVPDSLRSKMIVADVVADPPRTWLLRQAAERNCAILDGLGMYIDQVAVALELWTGVAPDTDVMREAIEEFLEV